MDNFKFKPATVTNFHCEGCDDFNEYLTKADIAVDADGYVTFSDLCTTYRAGNELLETLSNRHKTKYSDSESALYNTLLWNDFGETGPIGWATLSAFQVDGQSQHLVLPGTNLHMHKRIGTLSPPSRGYYRLTRTPNALTIVSMDGGTGDITNDEDYGLSSVTYTKSDFEDDVIPLRLFILGGAGGGGGSSGTTLKSGGGGGGGTAFGGILDLATCSTYDFYIGVGGAPGEVAGDGGDTTVYAIPGTSDPYIVCQAPGGYGANVQTGGSSRPYTDVTNNLPWGFDWIYDDGTTGEGVLTCGGGGGGTGGDAGNKGGDVTWEKTGKIQCHPGNCWHPTGTSFPISNSVGGGDSDNPSSFGAGGGASFLGDGGDDNSGSDEEWWISALSDGALGSGGGGKRYHAGCTGSVRRGGYGGDGYIELFY